MNTVLTPNDLKWIKNSGGILEATVSQGSQLLGYMSSNKEPVRHVRDIPGHLLDNRIVFLPAVINDEVANNIIGLLLHLQYKDASSDIDLYINCHGALGGELYEGLAIYDTMQYLKPDISTVCVGVAMGVAAVLLAAGTKGKRYCLPHSSVILHQPLSGVTGQVTDIDIRVRELLRQRNLLYGILAQHTQQPIELITKDADRKNYLSAQQAVEYGLVDEIITSEKDTTAS